MIKRLRRPLTLALSREGRGNGIVLAIAFAPSPLTGEGWDEGGADNSVFKRLRRPPLTLALSHKGRGNCIVLAEHRLLLLLLP